jgi:hypothetical protein
VSEQTSDRANTAHAQTHTVLVVYWDRLSSEFEEKIGHGCGGEEEKEKGVPLRRTRLPSLAAFMRAFSPADTSARHNRRQLVQRAEIGGRIGEEAGTGSEGSYR